MDPVGIYWYKYIKTTRLCYYCVWSVYKDDNISS